MDVFYSCNLIRHKIIYKNNVKLINNAPNMDAHIKKNLSKGIVFKPNSISAVSPIIAVSNLLSSTRSDRYIRALSDFLQGILRNTYIYILYLFVTFLTFYSFLFISSYNS